MVFLEKKSEYIFARNSYLHNLILEVVESGNFMGDNN